MHYLLVQWSASCETESPVGSASLYSLVCYTVTVSPYLSLEPVNRNTTYITTYKILHVNL